MDQATQDQIKGLFADAVKPIGDRLTALEAQGKENSTRLAKVETGEVFRVDATGKVVPFGDGKPIDGAPAVVRKDSLGSRFYSIGRIMQAKLERNPEVATLELEVSRVMKAMNFPHQSDGAELIPMGLEFLPDMGQQADNLRKLLKDAWQLPTVDPDEYRALAKQYHMIRKVMDPLQDTQGGSLIPFPERGDLVELLRAALVVTQAGAQFVPLPPGGLDYPTETGRTTFAWRQMGVQSDITESSATTGSVKLTPKELSGLTKVPNSLIRFSRPAAEALVRRSLSSDAALAADLGYLEGQGGTSPLGVLFYPKAAAFDTPEVNKVSTHQSTAGANGDTFSPNSVYKMIALVEEANDQEGPTGWGMRPLKFYNIANARADAVTGGDQAGPYLFPVTRGQLGNDVQKILAGLKVVTSTQISKTRAKGTGLNLTYVLLANWRRMVVGMVGALELAVSTEAGFARNETWFRACLYSDSALLHPESFVLCDTLLI